MVVYELSPSVGPKHEAEDPAWGGDALFVTILL